MKTITTLIGLASCAMALNACASNKPVDLGDDKTGTSAEGLAAYEGDWDGYAEAYKFASGSDRVRIALDAEGHGTIEVGDAPAIPPFTDPNVGYPDPSHYDDFHFYEEPQEGYGYPVGDAAVHSGRISFTFWPSDLQKDWCEAQRPAVSGLHTLADGTMTPDYDCGRRGSNFGRDGQGGDSGQTSDAPATCDVLDGAPGDCGFSATCVAACTCDESGCTASREPSYMLQVDAALDADGHSLVGTLVLRDARATIRLQRP